MRGYAAIGLDRPKDTANLGGVLRAAQCYGAALVMMTGGRMGKYSTDTMKAYRHLPCVEVDDLLAHCPYGAEPVVVEIVERAKPLFNFVHPHSAFYIFGPEDGGVRKEIVERVARVVQIPTKGCMNLAATANVILYDRLLKQFQRDDIGSSQ
jgi:tRNA(Leu) C34 or U34 (ribose-2'-O)-methylase TrmL